LGTLCAKKVAMQLHATKDSRAGLDMVKLSNLWKVSKNPDSFDI